MRKTKYLLEAIVKANLSITYYAVDLSESSLRQSMIPLVTSFPSLKFVGLWGTYHDSLHWINANIAISNKMYLWLGSSIGNMTRDESTQFLESVKNTAMKPGDLFICGMDRRNRFEEISLAYNDTANLTRDFIMTGLENCNHIIGSNVFPIENFSYLSIYNENIGRHEAYYTSTIDQTIKISGHSIKLAKGELINVEYSYKYSEKDVCEMLHGAKLYQVGKWTDQRNLYDLHLFQCPPFFLNRNATLEDKSCPTIEHFEQIWSAWDSLTGSMIARDRLNIKPINLRLPYIFYMGHLPTFFDIQLSKSLNEPLTSPTSFSDIFERGMDPDIDDPTKCHSHSIIPDKWPAIEEILEYQTRVRQRIRLLLQKPLSKRLQRVLRMGYEHDGMHMETLLYMLVQDLDHCPPSLIAKPILNVKSQQQIPENVWLPMTGGDLVLGLDDPEAGDFTDAPPCKFGWDNEKGKNVVNVKRFEIQHRPIAIGEYLSYLQGCIHLEEAIVDILPASWKQEGESYSVLTIFGKIDIHLCLHWPVYVSVAQAMAYAARKGMQLPTEAQLKYALTNSHASIYDNHSFASLTPRDVTRFTDGITDLTGNGWECTQTVFEPYPGFETGTLYPGYSSDFL